MKYEADLGKWEQGRVVDIEAATPDEAYTEAVKMLENGEDELDDEVVQIREKHSRKCVYDYMNGFSIYRRLT